MWTNLTNEQEKIVNKSGKYVVEARAGSGKTLTLSKKLIKLIKNNKEMHTGIATLSFTNIAWKEIKNNLISEGIEIKHPNFIGTLDKFINKFIFFRYYYLLEEFNQRPELVGNFGIPWMTKNNEYHYNQYFDCFSFDLNDKLIKTRNKNTFFKFDPENEKNKHYKNIKKMKNKLFQRGYVTQDDINYFSYKLIKKHSFISKNIAKRFPYFLVDEAQDTNEIKIKILKYIMSEKDIKEFAFIGDFNQAIYEWNGAKPELFEDLSDEFEKIQLKDNWRSSQKICDFTSNMINKKINSCNDEVKDFDFKPSIEKYDKKKANSDFYNRKIDEFLNICKKHNIKINKDNVAVLCRGQSLVNEIKNINSDYKEKEDNIFINKLIKSKIYYDSKDLKESYSNLKYIFIALQLKDNKNFSTFNKIEKELDFNSTREECYKLVKILPSLDNKTVHEWVTELKNILKESNFKYNEKLLKKLENNNENNIKIQGLFNTPNSPRNYTLSTIHQSKGKTFEAVLIFIKNRTQKKSYKNIIDEYNESNKLSEELRIIYVGITRPKKILVLYVPKEDFNSWNKLFYTKNQH